MRHLKVLFVAAAIVASPAAPAAFAQQSPVVVMEYERVLATSLAGRDVEAKLRQIAEQMQGELRPEQTAIQTEAQNLQQATQGRSQEQISRDNNLQSRIQALNTRSEAFRQQQVTKARDLEFTRQQALNALNQQLEPIVREVMNARRASAVLDGNAVHLAAENADITQDVISRLDQRVRTINVTRQTAPAQQQQNR